MHYKYYYVYILKCADNSYYIGVTNDVNYRTDQHTDGINPDCYTYRRRPITLVHHEEFTDINAAIRREKQLKGWNRKKKEALINGQLENLPKLSERTTDKRALNTLRVPQGDIS